jgi:hypothetical protein
MRRFYSVKFILLPEEPHVTRDTTVTTYDGYSTFEDIRKILATLQWGQPTRAEDIEILRVTLEAKSREG